MRLSFFIPSAITVAILTACGGGGSGGTSSVPLPTQNTPTTQVISAPSPSMGSSVDLTSTRATIMAATRAAVSGSATVALPTSSGGKILYLPFEQYWSFNLTSDGKIYGLSRPGETLLVDPNQVKMACLFAGRVGWGVNGARSVACGPMLKGEGSPVPNYAKLPLTCNNDAGTYAVVMRGALKSGKDGSSWDDWEDGEVLWGDFNSERKFTFESNTEVPMEAKFMASGPNAGLIEYGRQGLGYQQATVKYVGGELRYDFGSNCAGGFGKDNKLTALDPAKPLMFVFHSNKSGADGKDGWGFGTTNPSTMIAWWQVDAGTGNGYVSFPNVKCGTAGNISVYEQLPNPVPGNEWDTKGDGYGSGWGIIQKLTDLIQFWTTGPGVTLDRDKYQVVTSACPA